MPSNFITERFMEDLGSDQILIMWRKCALWHFFASSGLGNGNVFFFFLVDAESGFN